MLVNPAFDGGAEAPPLGLLCLAAVLIEGGFETRVMDLDVPHAAGPHDRLREEVETFSPSIIGVTSTSRNFGSALNDIRSAKEISPGLISVMGGVHATVANRGILENVPELDFLIRGEGENSFLQLVRNLEAESNYLDVDGLSFRSNGAIVHNPHGRPADLDEFPLPAHDLVRNGDYATRSISAGRGCFHGCTFCSIKEMYGSSVRFRSIRSVAEEIHRLISLGARRIMFTDDNFTADRGRLAGLCGAVVKTGLAGRAEYIIEGRLDDVARHPLSAQVLGESGFRYIYAGAESGSQRVLDRYIKRTTPDVMLKGAMHCLENNVMPVVNFILFGPFDDIGSIRETLSYARRLFESGVQIAYTETLTPYPGTPVREWLKKENRLCERDGIYWFETDGYPGYEEFLSICKAAREHAQKSFGHMPLFDQQRVYYEMGCLDEILSEYAASD